MSIVGWRLKSSNPKFVSVILKYYHKDSVLSIIGQVMGSWVMLAAGCGSPPTTLNRHKSSVSQLPKAPDETRAS